MLNLALSAFCQFFISFFRTLSRHSRLSRVQSGLSKTCQTVNGEKSIKKVFGVSIIEIDMILIKANNETEAGVMPSEELLTEKGKYNEELAKAGVLLAGEGLHPSSQGARVKCSGDKRLVIDGPFAETKEYAVGEPVNLRNI
jgi:hypothetical protein